MLVVGLPRSGTTWVAEMLGSCDATALVHEPDNPTVAPFALRKRGLPGGYYTALAPDDDAPVYEKLWREAFRQPPVPETAWSRVRRRGADRLLDHARRRGHPRASFTTQPHVAPSVRAAAAFALPSQPSPARHVVVKSVHAVRSVEWVSGRTGAGVVLVFRDLRSVVSSWVEVFGIAAGAGSELEVADPMRLRRRASDLGIPPPPQDALERTTWLLAVLSREMQQAAARHPEWAVVHHEDLLADPVSSLRALAGRLTLPWGPRSDDLVRASNRPGTGYSTQRVAAESRDAWRRRLTTEQERRVSAVVTAVGTPT